MHASNILSRFDMETKKGLVWVTNPKDDASNLSEILAIAEAQRFKADAVYFRRLDNPVRSIPQVYIYNRDLSDEELVDIHTILWSSSIVPIFYIVTSSTVKIFNCTKSVRIKDSQRISEPIKEFNNFNTIEQELADQKYSAKLLDNGLFWETHPQFLDVAESPYQKLLNGLLAAKKYLTKEQPQLHHSTLNKLLVMGILVKYLESKEAKKGQTLLEISRDFYHQFPDCEEFTDIIRHNKLIFFLHELNQKFNGNVFHLTDVEKKQLNEVNLHYIADVLDARIEAQQYVLWNLYAFNYLPIELISGIYEAFLKAENKEKGIVYTPPYLVNLLIDECMPLHEARKLFGTRRFKVLDPACGSGIFLVAALKRMVQWEAILAYQQTGVVRYPDLEIVKDIARNNLFGIDIEPDAALISLFSLCIALCDKLSPMQIWNDLRFDELQITNIQTGDFFEKYPTQQFDLVIGNPPFNPPTGFNNKSYLKEVKIKFGLTPQFALNDDHIALFFWDKAVQLRKAGGKICFILPAGAWLYNHNAFAYRRAFMSKYCVEKIIDFTHLSDKLFHGSAHVAVCCVIASDLLAQMPKNLWHLVIKRSKIAEERFFFEVDHYDFHKVSYRLALENAFIWKCNLLGGGRLFRLVRYLQNLRTLEAFLKNKKEVGWVFGEGYIVGHANPLIPTESIEKGRKRVFQDKVDWITNQKTIKTATFDELGTFETTLESECYFVRSTQNKKDIFKPPHILIKENLGQKRIPMAFLEEYMCFKHEIFGIHAPAEQIVELRQLYKTLNKEMDLFRFYLLCTSARSGVNKSPFPINARDLTQLPYPEDLESLQLSESERAIQKDVLNYFNTKNKNTNKILNSPVDNETLEVFGSLFCKTLNPIYEQKDMKWFIGSFKTTASITMYAFFYGKPCTNALPHLFEGDLESIETLVYNQSQRHLRMYRVLRQYVHIDGYDVLILVKPATLRYWLQSIALRDADETFSDLKINGF